MIGLRWVAQTAGCLDNGAPSPAACPDDSGPNLLVRGVGFLFAVALVATAVWAVRRARLELRRRRDDEDATDAGPPPASR